MFFIDVDADTMVANIDKQAYSIIKASGVKIMPILSNANFKSLKREFDGNALHRILHSDVKKKQLITNIINNLAANNFVGINIDFEELKENDNRTLTNFPNEQWFLRRTSKVNSWLVVSR
jgi:spore germination protein YaaH